MRSFPHLALHLLCIALVSLASPVRASTEPDRFFLRGDGKIHIKNMKTGREASVSLLNPDNSLSEEGFTLVDEVFGFPTMEKGEHICPRLIFMLDHFSDLVAPDRMIRMESAYRSPDYNNALREKGGNVARTSLHMDGMALDFNIEGIDGKALWELIRSRDCCGVGHYGGATIHLDSGRPRFWEAGTSGTRTGESEQNRRIHLASDYDRYRPGEPVRLSLSSISDFGFGIRPTVTFVPDSQEHAKELDAPILQGDETGCIPIGDRKASRFIHVSVPDQLPEGRYRVRIVFCRSPFPEMPHETFSNLIQVFKDS